MTKKRKIRLAIREYNRLLHKDINLRILAEQLEWNADFIDDKLGEINFLRAIHKYKKSKGKLQEATFISHWIDSIDLDESINLNKDNSKIKLDIDPDPEIIKYVN